MTNLLELYNAFFNNVDNMIALPNVEMSHLKFLRYIFRAELFELTSNVSKVFNSRSRLVGVMNGNASESSFYRTLDEFFLGNVHAVTGVENRCRVLLDNATINTNAFEHFLCRLAPIGNGVVETTLSSYLMNSENPTYKRFAKIAIYALLKLNSGDLNINKLEIEIILKKRIEESLDLNFKHAIDVFLEQNNHFDDYQTLATLIILDLFNNEKEQESCYNKLEFVSDATNEELGRAYLLEFYNEMPTALATPEIFNALASAQLRKGLVWNELYSQGKSMLVDSEMIFTPYYLLYGSTTGGSEEFSITQGNIQFSLTPSLFGNNAISEIVPDFKSRMNEQADFSVRLGYDRESTLKLRLDKIIEHSAPETGNIEMLEFKLGVIDYFTHRVLRDCLVDFNGLSLTGFAKQYYGDYLTDLKTGLENSNAIDYSHLLWPMCGCGIWIKTKDGMLIFSHRKNVADDAGLIGYSASGSCNSALVKNGISIEGDPFSNIQNEMIEELGLIEEEANINLLKLISVGVDLKRCVIQFSFFVDMPIDSNVFIERHKIAKDRAEQDIFMVAFKRKHIEFILKHYSMEAGAAYSLYQILRKYFYDI